MSDMNRRSFMKKIGGALAGVVALGLPSKIGSESLLNENHPLAKDLVSYDLFTFTRPVICHYQRLQ